MAIDISNIQKSKRPRPKKKVAKGKNFWKKELTIGKPFGDKEKVSFYKELGSLLEAGVDFKRALEILAEQQVNDKHKERIETIKNDIIGGKPLYEAMRDIGVFSPYEYFSVKIGEESRSLNGVLPELYQYFERKIQLRRQLTSVLMYPAFVLLLTFGVLYFMMNYVVPMFSTVFKQFGRELPALTQKIIYLSEHFTTFAIIFGIVVAAIIGIHFYSKQKQKYRHITSSVMMRIPFFGKLIKKIYITRFSQSLSLLLKAKTPLVTALDLVEKMISFYPIEKSLSEIKVAVTRGSSFSKALKEHKMYDHKLVSLVSVAEEANTLDLMFERLSQQYNKEMEHQTKMLGSVIEPLIILIIGAVVGVVLIAMYAPMFDLSKILQTN